MAAGREHIERWLSGTNQELSLDKGYTHPAHSTTLPQPKTTIVSNSTGSSPPSLLLPPPHTSKSVSPHQSSHISLSKRPGFLSVHSPSFTLHSPLSSHSAPSSPSLLHNKLSPPPPDRLSVDKDDRSRTLSLPSRASRASRHLLTKSVSSDHYLSNDYKDALRDGEYVTEHTLTLLSEYIGASKLPLLVTQLGLPASVLEDALSNYKLPDTRALYVLRVWLGKEEEGGGGTVSELVRALELIGLCQLAHQVRNGEVKPLKKKLSSDYDVSNRNTKHATSFGGISGRKPLVHCHGFSLQGDDGERTLILKDGVQVNHSQVKDGFNF